MKLKITGRAVHDKDGELIPVGTIISLESDEVPSWLANKVEVLGAPTAESEPVLNVEQDDLDKKAEAARQVEDDKAAAAKAVVDKATKA